MLPALSPTRAALSGSAVVMACACGAAANSATLLLLAGVGATAAVLHPMLIGVGAALIVHGLWRTSRRSAYLALAAFGVLAAAAVLTPQSAMSSGDMGPSSLPWSGPVLAGAALYVAAAATLGYALWRAFPSAKPAASATAIGGMVLATGCNCCMVTGAMAGMAVTAGASAAYFQSMPLVFWAGLLVVTVGLYRMGGVRAALWAPAGGLVVMTGLDFVNSLFGQPKIAGVNPYFVLKYALMLAGFGLVMRGFVVAYQVASAGARAAAGTPLAARPLAEGGAGD